MRTPQRHPASRPNLRVFRSISIACLFEALTRENLMAMVVDPVCGMHIDDEEAAGTVEYEGTTYSFCSQACHDAFVANPSEYVS